MSTENDSRILEAIRSKPGRSRAQLSSSLGLCAETISRHCLRLERDGLITGLLKPRGNTRFKRYYPVEDGWTWFCFEPDKAANPFRRAV